MQTIHLSMSLALALSACVNGTDTNNGEGADSTGDDPGQATVDDSTGEDRAEGSCERMCRTDVDCATADEAQDWLCNLHGHVGVCEYAGDAPLPCEPTLCPEGSGLVCTPVAGLNACVTPCPQGNECAPPTACTGLTDNGDPYCTPPDDAPCNIWGDCTCTSDDECPVDGTICAPPEG